MRDFLSFNTFITPDVLFISYYLGVVLMPFIAIALWRKLGQRLTKRVSSPTKTKQIAGTIVLVLIVELLWRMMFETMLAYFQMRDALLAALG